MESTPPALNLSKLGRIAATILVAPRGRSGIGAHRELICYAGRVRIREDDMRIVLLFPFTVAACTTAAPPADDLQARQEGACTAVIADHVGRPPSEIVSRVIATSDSGATVEARDGARLHLCTVDAAGRVLGYAHPGA
ncbi:hypothetical protein GI374_05930 [Paracoccus sp. S-4012]|uniref:hypothetical protein n=1 Tax=Paracoccus sp. S-4012 TaxID=2665648 RepID=UPI0012AF8208|nr:hypothetical protein [Paracoccus sp. S-4012]MRX49996.1 hypothetical protein [Paracoccus sp. S-4012]